MTKDEISVKSSKASEIPKVQDGDAITLKTPYYWSWYRCVFSSNDARSGDVQGISAREKQRT